MNLLVPIAIVHSSLSGLHVGNGVLIDAWQRTDGTSRICTDAIPCEVWFRYWVSDDWRDWAYDTGQPCPYPNGWSYRSATGYGPRSTIKPSAGDIMYFDAVDQDNNAVSGSWSQPFDWGLDAERGRSSADFFDFLADFFAGDADFNLDQRTDTHDLFDYLFVYMN